MKRWIVIFSLTISVLAFLLVHVNQTVDLAAPAPAVVSETNQSKADESFVPASIRLGPGVERFLEQGFCTQGLCGERDWGRWIVVEDGSDWTVGQLRMVQAALLNTLIALEQNDVDGQLVLSGYRFNRYNGTFVDGKANRLAVVRHEQQLITLADTAFQSFRGFVIYHELGHVVDRQLGRRLTNEFTSLAAEAQAFEVAGQSADGYWMRDQAEHDPAEAAADAFALWVMVEEAGYAAPEFGKTSPEQRSRLSGAVRSALAQ